MCGASLCYVPHSGHVHLQQYTNTVTAAAGQLAADVPLAQSYEQDVSSLGPPPSLDPTISDSVNYRSSLLYRRQSSGNQTYTGNSSFLSSSTNFQSTGQLALDGCATGFIVNPCASIALSDQGEQIDADTDAIAAMEVNSCSGQGYFPNTLANGNTVCSNVFQAINTVGNLTVQYGQELQGNITLVMQNFTNFAGYVNSTSKRKASIAQT